MEFAAPAMSNRSATYMLLLLSSVNFLNALDKVILSILVEPIKAEFGLTDGEVGVVSGLALALSTGIVMIPMGLLADRTNRRNLVATSLIVWSGVTALGGMAQSYVQLLASRIVVGIGEAGGGPPSLSMISDIFPKARRATASSIFFISAPMGGMAALAGGGWIAGHYGWRTTLVAAGLPGILVALLLLLTTSEPKRGALDPEIARWKARPTFWHALDYIRGRRSLLHLLAGVALIAFAASGMATWTPAFFMRSHEMSLERAGPLLALVQGTGVIGPILGALVADRLAVRDQRWWCWIVATGATIGGAAIAGCTLLADVRPALFFNGLYIIAVSVWYGLSYGTVQSLVPPEMRATVMSIFYVVGTVVGFGLGTQFVGAGSDLLAPYVGGESLRYALSILSLVCIWAGVHFALAARSLRGDLERTSGAA